MREERIVENISDTISQIKKRDDEKLVLENGFGNETDVMESTGFDVTTQFMEWWGIWLYSDTENFKIM